MNTRDPLTWAALRLHRIITESSRRAEEQAERTTATAAANLAGDAEALRRLSGTLVTAESRGWRGAAAIVRERLRAQAARLQDDCATLRQSPPRRRDRPPPPPPSVTDLVAELRQLDEEFDHVEIQTRQRRIVARTDAITLEDVALGPFSIELSFDGLANHRDASAFEVVADEPNPAGGDDGGHPHPHVSGGSLCAGDATVPIASALAQGRIADAFVLVNAVLHTYNPASAYVALSEWDGGRVTCSDCGRRCHGDDPYFCDGCGGDYCESCISNCARCDRTRCLSCLPQDDDDDDDDERLCQHCRRTCRACGSTADAAQLRRQDGLCDACAADDEEGQEEAVQLGDLGPAEATPTASPPAPITGPAVGAVAPGRPPLPTESFT